MREWRLVHSALVATVSVAAVIFTETDVITNRRSRTSEIKVMPDLKLKMNEMAAKKVQSAADYMTKIDSKLIKGINSNGIKSGESLNDLKKALKQVIVNIEKDTTASDRYGNSLPYYEARFKKCMGNEKFLEIFMQLPIEEQKAWVIEEFKNICPDLPQTVVEMLPGALYPGDCGRPLTEKPDWLDMDKFRKGQKFQQDNYATTWLAILYGLYALYNLEDGLRPILMNNQSHTPYKAFRRYLSTMKRMDEIFVGDPWTEGTPAYKEVQSIRMQHLAVRQKLCKHDNETLHNASILNDPYAPTYDVIRKDIDAFCPSPAQGQCPFNLWSYSESGKPKSLSQIAMVLTQYGFVSFVITNPEFLGIYNATDENLEAFCHMWRGVGYLVGIQDEFNFCQGSLEEIKQRSRDITEYWVKPSFINYNKDAEHATRAIYDGVNYYVGYLNYEVMTLELSKLLNIQMPNLYASLSYPTWFFYNSFNLLAHRLINISLVRKILNKLFLYSKERALAFDDKKLAKLRETSKKSVLHVSIRKPLVAAQ